jgi:Uma2 family endonuclease
MQVEVHKRLFTADEYQRMGEAGIFPPGDRVELIDGAILTMSPIGSPHAAAVNRANQLFVLRTAGRAVVAVQNPIRLNTFSEPQPDLSVLRPRDDFYESALPRPADVLLVIEIAETTLRFDRDVKAPVYGRNGIVEYWLVDLAGETVTRYRTPGNDAYTDVVALSRGQVLSPLHLPDVVMGTDDLLG